MKKSRINRYSILHTIFLLGIREQMKSMTEIAGLLKQRLPQADIQVINIHSNYGRQVIEEQNIPCEFDLPCLVAEGDDSSNWVIIPALGDAKTCVEQMLACGLTIGRRRPESLWESTADTESTNQVSVTLHASAGLLFIRSNHVVNVPTNTRHVEIDSKSTYQAVSCAIGTLVKIARNSYKSRDSSNRSNKFADNIVDDSRRFLQ